MIYQIVQYNTLYIEKRLCLNMKWLVGWFEGRNLKTPECGWVTLSQTQSTEVQVLGLQYRPRYDYRIRLKEYPRGEAKGNTYHPIPLTPS